jgi:hypothetical protein
MKTKLILFCTLIVLLAGCELIKDANTVSISTDLTANVPIEVLSAGKKSANLAGSVNALSFSKTQDLTLASNTDIEPYLAKIKEINLNSLVVTVNGLSSGQTISSISLNVTGVGNIFTQTNITMSNNSFTPAISAAILGQVATKLTSDKTITLTLSGSASGPMSITVSLNFDTTVVAKVL